jgi:hypothetical protein
MMQLLYTIHGHNRWLVLASALLALGLLAYTWLAKKEWNPVTQRAVLAYNILVSLQFLIGLSNIWFIGSSREWQAMRLTYEHVGTMFIALAIGHFSARWKSLPDTERAQKTFITIAISFGLVLLGVARIRGFGYWFSM